MTPERYALICELFDRALALPPDRRDAFLREACGDDEKLRRAVERMLGHHDDARLAEPCPLNVRSLLDPVQTAGWMPGQAVGPYVLRELLGSGGMGTVWLAERVVDYRERVALKLIRADVVGPADLKRFQAERQALAELNHPNVARLLGGGSTESGQPYLAMEYVEGLALDDFCDEGQVSTRQRAELMLQVARGVHHAHERKLLHRDLKPSNVLVTPQGVPKVVDFGLAKRLDQAETTRQTQTGAILGTPSYMAPEQAGGRVRDLGPPTDVWALGAVLYELITGRAPFRADTLTEILLQVMQSDPVRPSRLLPGLPRDLETITLKALNKEPARRYGTAGEMADDLQRFLDGRPIKARRTSTVELAWRWCRRNSGMAAMAVVLLVLVLAGVAGVVAFGFWERHLRTEAEVAREVEREHLYIKLIALAEEQLRTNNPEQADRLLAQCPEHLRDWEWRFLDARSQGRRPLRLNHAQGVWAVTFSPDGKHLATGSINGFVTIYEPRAGKVERSLFKLDLGQLINPVLCLDFAPGADRPWLAAGKAGGQVQVWDVTTQKVIHDLAHQKSSFATAVKFSPDGRQLASTCWAGTVRLWDLDSVTSPRDLIGHTGPVNGLAFSPDGRLIATCGFDRTVRLWDAASGAEVATLVGHTNAVRDVTFSPVDSSVLVSASFDGTLRVWDVPGRREVAKRDEHNSPVLAVAFSADGRRLATGSFDKTIKIWETKRWQEVVTLRDHADMVWGVTWSPDGDLLASASFDRSVRVWNASPTAEGRSSGEAIRPVGGWVTGVAYNHDGTLVASGGWDGTVHVWEPGKSEDALTLRGHDAEVWGVAFNHDGTLLATSSWDKKIKVWDRATGQVRHEWSSDILAHSVSFSPGGDLLAGTAWDGVVTVWDVKTGKEVRRIEHAKWYPVFTAVFSPDGKTLATAGGDKTAALWEVATGKELRRYKGHVAAVHGVAFTPDGKTLATSSWDNTVRLWDAAKGTELKVLDAHKNRVNAVAFSPDGKWLASASEDKTVRLWRMPGAEPTSHVFEHREAVWSLAFSPDGRHLAAGGWDRVVRFWDVPAPP